MGTEAILKTEIVVDSSKDLWLDFLALIYHTYYCAHSAHWNVRGSSFGAWHEFFGDAYEYWQDKTDTVAEHIKATFDSTDIPPNFQTLLSRVQGDPTSGIELDGVGFFQALLVYQEAIVAVLKELYKVSSAKDDQASIDLITEILREVKKQLWQTKSHLQ